MCDNEPYIRKYLYVRFCIFYSIKGICLNVLDVFWSALRRVSEFFGRLNPFPVFSVPSRPTYL